MRSVCGLRGHRKLRGRCAGWSYVRANLGDVAKGGFGCQMKILIQCSNRAFSRRVSERRCGCTGARARSAKSINKCRALLQRNITTFSLPRRCTLARPPPVRPDATRLLSSCALSLFLSRANAHAAAELMTPSPRIMPGQVVRRTLAHAREPLFRYYSLLLNNDLRGFLCFLSLPPSTSRSPIRVPRATTVTKCAKACTRLRGCTRATRLHRLSPFPSFSRSSISSSFTLDRKYKSREDQREKFSVFALSGRVAGQIRVRAHE